MTGKIIKGIAGFYYINDGRNHVYQCKAKGSIDEACSLSNYIGPASQ
ncbi:MAG: hypothetical protein ACLTL7_26445, partial [Enterocloster bolteae]